MKRTWKQLFVVKIWLVTKLSIILMNLKKEDMNYKIVKIFNPVENLKWAIRLTIDIKTVNAAELKTKLGFNQVDSIMSIQESIGLRLKKTFWVKK